MKTIMKKLKTISDLEVTRDKIKESPKRKREAARAVLFNEANQVAILYVSKFNYHKLPGGGIEKGEDIQKALEREVMEETGCDLKVTEEIGIVEEIRGKLSLHQISYCFLAQKVGEAKETEFTKKELNQGFVFKWMSLNEAINVINNDLPKNYEGKFIKARDLIFLENVKNILKT